MPDIKKPDIKKVVILGANGAMGAGSGEIFAAEGIETVFLARDLDRAAKGRARAESMAKADAISKHIQLGTYERDLPAACATADLIFECVSEDLALKNQFFDLIEKHRRPDSIVATVSSGLSIAAMVAGRSDSFRRHFLGLHLFNPPNVIVGCEVIPHGETDPALTAFVLDFLERRLGRKVIETADLPAFAGNRIGFKVLNECAQLAEEHGVLYVDLLVGPHTGRAMAPLATVDFVGWDVHKAIVDNLYANTRDEAHEAFKLPAYMQRLIDKGHLGNKTADKGGFTRREKKADKTVDVFVLDPRTGEYRKAEKPAVPELVKRMRELHRLGRYRDAMRAMLEASGNEAELMRKVVLGYLSYGLGRVGEVVKAPRDVDRIMGFGFNWAPPGVLVDVMGAKNVLAALEKARLPVPKALVTHAETGKRMFTEPHADLGRFFVGG